MTIEKGIFRKEKYFVYFSTVRGKLMSFEKGEKVRKFTCASLEG